MAESCGKREAKIAQRGKIIAENSVRSSRESRQHDKQVRRKPWSPVRKLDTPPAPPGYTIGG